MKGGVIYERNIQKCVVGWEFLVQFSGENMLSRSSQLEKRFTQSDRINTTSFLLNTA